MAKGEKSTMESKPPDQKLAELKEELQRLVGEILQGGDDGSDSERNDDDRFSFESVKKALKTLEDLQDWKGKGKGKAEEATAVIIPEEFLCPLSKEIMKEPVIISTGHTYDRRFIKSQLDRGYRSCPQSQEAILDTTLIPNLLVRKIIAKWCLEHNFEPPHQDPTNERAPLTASDRARLLATLDKLNSPTCPLHEKKSAAKELRSFTKRHTSYRAIFGVDSTEPIDKILRAFTTTATDRRVLDPDLQTDLVTAIFNLSIDEESKRLLGEHPLVLLSLVHSLQQGPTEARRNAAAAVFSLSALDSNKVMIANAGGIGPLIRLLGDELEGDPMTAGLIIRDVAQAIFSLATMKELRSRVIEHGLVAVALDKIRKNVLVDELLAILAIFNNHLNALVEIAKLGGAVCLLQAVRRSWESSTNNNNKISRVVENGTALLCALCMYQHSDVNVLDQVAKDEMANGTIHVVASNGSSSSRARRKANAILAKIDKINVSTHDQHPA